MDYSYTSGANPSATWGNPPGDRDGYLRCIVAKRTINDNTDVYS